MLKYKIPEIPPSNNVFIGRENRFQYQKIKKEMGKAYRVCLFSETAKAA